MRVWTAISLALLSLPSAATDPTREVPSQFLGAWCTEPSSEEENTGESDIRIGKSEIDYYQDTGEILAVAATRNELALIVQVTVAGDTGLTTHEFELSSNGDKLTALRPGGQLLVRGRCGTSPGGPPDQSSSAKPGRGPA